MKLDECGGLGRQIWCEAAGFARGRRRADASPGAAVRRDCPALPGAPISVIAKARSPISNANIILFPNSGIQSTNPDFHFQSKINRPHEINY
ncbi:hypothetical protein [Burkholderia savannae]|uniref:hypothetical protein n=1 Tax=Burkholderia savannae TaxID=1637837 RepID=UPI001CF7777A|nr:hypothetical protein [Burkholderia savannae]